MKIYRNVKWKKVRISVVRKVNNTIHRKNRYPADSVVYVVIKQLLDEVEHDIMNYQNRGLCYLPKPKAEADNTDTRF